MARRPAASPKPSPPVTKLGKTIAEIDFLTGDKDSAPSPDPGARLRMRPYKRKPMIGILSIGHPYTIINWDAAGVFGIRKTDPRIAKCPYVESTGPDGVARQLPLVRLRVNLCGFTHSLCICLPVQPPHHTA